MIRASTESALETRRRAASKQGGAGLWHTTFIGSNRFMREKLGQEEGDTKPEDPNAIYPMAFLVEQDPSCEFQPHFHQANQFQVVVAGSGWLGTHALNTVSVHYVNAYTPYGPIRSSAAGLHYMTLRNGWDAGARHMAVAAAELRTIKRNPREVVGELVALKAPLARARGAEKAIIPLLPESSDGLGAWLHRLPPGQKTSGPDPSSGRGQFWLVLGGTHEDEGSVLRELSCVFVAPDEPGFIAVAGSDGLEIACLQFPLIPTIPTQ